MTVQLAVNTQYLVPKHPQDLKLMFTWNYYEEFSGEIPAAFQHKHGDIFLALAPSWENDGKECKYEGGN